jgi:hypothetical protein
MMLFLHATGQPQKNKKLLDSDRTYDMCNALIG